MSILKNKWFILGNVLLLLAVIPVTLFLVRQQADQRSSAAPSTTLSFEPTTSTIGVGETATFDIFVDPGQNIVSILELNVSVDPDFLEIVSIERNETAFPGELQEGTVVDNTATIAMTATNTNTATGDVNSVGGAIQEKTKAATLVVKAIAQTTSPSIIQFDTPPSQAFSLATSDGVTENVLAGTGTASVTVVEAGSVTGTPTPTTTPGLGGVSPTTTPSPTLSATNTAPVCSALTLDRAATGPAPYAIIFTATGSDATGAISNVVFNFGDGPAQTISNGGGIGTGNVNVQIAHTFSTPGTYSVTATLTDNGGLTSNTATCTQQVTITQGATTGGGTGGGTGGNSTAGTPIPTLPVTGTLETALMIGGAAAVAVIVGVFLFIL